MDTVSCLCQVLGHNFFGEVEEKETRTEKEDVSKKREVTSLMP
jgi:hypothetical protein